MTKFLLIDDHAIVTAGLRLIIEDFIKNCEVDEVTNTDAAFDRIKKTNYDLIICDITMPNTYSLGFVGNILSFKPTARVLMFSMNSEEIYAKRYFKIGAMGFLRKDAPQSEIRKAIENVLADKKYISPELSEKLLFESDKQRNKDNPFDNLSPREFEIVQHMAKGDSLAEIAKKLNLHTSTIGTHKSRIFEKLNCHNVIELNELAKAHKVILGSS